MKLGIINDTSLNISCYVTSDDKRYFYESGEKNALYDFDSLKTAVIRIFKEDIWDFRQRVSTFMFIIHIFDWISGCLAESGNLPFSIDYWLPSEAWNTDPHVNVLLSEIVRVDGESLARWSKYSAIQCVAMTMVMIIIGCLLSLIFNGWGRIAFAVCVTFISVAVFIKINSRRKKLFQLLKVYIKPQIEW